MQQTLNAVIYARYSSHNQTEQSIEGQLRDCYAFAERQGLQVVGEYIDRTPRLPAHDCRRKKTAIPARDCLEI